MGDFNVAAVLMRGKENALHLNELSKMFGVSMGSVKAEIQRERRAGVLICSNTKGYFLAESREEMEAFNKSMHKQAMSRLVTSKPTRTALKEMDSESGEKE